MTSEIQEILLPSSPAQRWPFYPQGMRHNLKNTKQIMTDAHNYKGAKLVRLAHAAFKIPPPRICISTVFTLLLAPGACLRPGLASAAIRPAS
jgi:hypothetical protein